jgi:hypothetical protein
VGQVCGFDQGSGEELQVERHGKGWLTLWYCFFIILLLFLCICIETAFATTSGRLVLLSCLFLFLSFFLSFEGLELGMPVLSKRELLQNLVG